MPNARVLSEKQATVNELVKKLRDAQGGVFVDYTGTTVAADTEMRRAMRAAGVEYSVVKNTLTRIAADQVGYSELDPVLHGATSLAVSHSDPVAAAKSSASTPTKRRAPSRSRPASSTGKSFPPRKSAL